jgi:hypothetical protein
MDAIQVIVDAITAWVGAFVTLVLGVLVDFIPLFYVASPDGGTTPAELTVYGVLGLMGIAIGLVYLGLNFAKNFFLK